ncbi:MAG TPA: GIY-YIG nuclease family protein [Thermosynechococcaceae cyanobacterium]
MSEVLKAEALSVLHLLSATPFQELFPLSRNFDPVPSNPAFYAFRHRDDGILYIGISTNLRRRFRNGHKALSWAFVDRLSPDDVRIAAVPMGKLSPPQVERIESLMIQAVRPCYNVR